MLKSLMRPLLAGTILLSSAMAASAVTYVRGNDGDPETLDQHKTSTVVEAHLLRDLYEGLVVYDASAKIIPGVAEGWGPGAMGACARGPVRMCDVHVFGLVWV